MLSLLENLPLKIIDYNWKTKEMRNQINSNKIIGSSALYLQNMNYQTIIKKVINNRKCQMFWKQVYNL